MNSSQPSLEKSTSPPVVPPPPAIASPPVAACPPLSLRPPPSPHSTPRKPKNIKKRGPSTSACRSSQTNSIGMKLVLIPPGEFVMGSPKELIEEELRLHGSDGWYRTICRAKDRGTGCGSRSRIWLGVTEVTQEEYQRVMGSNPSKFQGRPEKARGAESSWDDAVEFCRRLSELPGEKAAKRRYRAANGGAVGICVPSGEPGRCGFSPQSGTPRQRKRSYWPSTAGSTRTRAARRTRWGRSGERLGPVRHARQRVGVVPGLV